MINLQDEFKNKVDICGEISVKSDSIPCDRISIVINTPQDYLMTSFKEKQEFVLSKNAIVGINLKDYWVDGDARKKKKCISLIVLGIGYIKLGLFKEKDVAKIIKDLNKLIYNAE